MENKQDFWAKCTVCGTEYLNHSGSTPCCGALAYIVEQSVPDYWQVEIDKYRKLRDSNKENISLFHFYASKVDLLTELRERYENLVPKTSNK